MPVSESMFVYVETASAVNSFAPFGIFRFCRSFKIVSEFFVYDCTKGKSSLRRKSNHVLKMEEKLLIQLTTGRRLRGVLCTFGSP
jgi:hypothetical protein